jgi:hypothetical protein
LALRDIARCTLDRKRLAGGKSMLSNMSPPSTNNIEPGRIENITPNNIKTILMNVLNSRIPIPFKFDYDAMKLSIAQSEATRYVNMLQVVINHIN